MGLLYPIADVVGDVEAQGIDVLRLVEGFNRNVGAHQLFPRHTLEGLPPVDHPRDLVGNRLPVVAEVFVARIGASVKAGRRARGDGRCRGRTELNTSHDVFELRRDAVWRVDGTFGMRKLSKGLNCATVSRKDNARRTMKLNVFQGSNLRMIAKRCIAN